jgi:hypothetical protein
MPHIWGGKGQNISASHRGVIILIRCLCSISSIDRTSVLAVCVGSGHAIPQWFDEGEDNSRHKHDYRHEAAQFPSTPAPLAAMVRRAGISIGVYAKS